MAAVVDEELDDSERKSIALFASKTLIERVGWLALGNWIGYFADAEIASDEERSFFKEYRELVPADSLPVGLREVRNNLSEQDSSTDSFFLKHFNAGFMLKRPMVEWYSIFEAALTVSEMLSDGPINSFFNFLQIGDAGIFKEHEADPDQVMSALRMTGADAFAFTNEKHPESVIAGFIRFTEYLSAMDGLFPNIELYAQSQFVPYENPARFADRDILLTLLAQMRWRFPADENGFSRFSAVLFAFINLGNQQFHRERSLAVEWDYGESMYRILGLAQRFFFPFVQEETEGREQIDPRQFEAQAYRQDAMKRRLLEIQQRDNERHTSAT